MAVDIAALLTASIDDFKAKMAEADASVKVMTDSSSSSMGKLSTLGKGALMGIVGGAVVVGAASLDMGAKFQSAMETIHTQAGASQAEVNKMSGAVLNLAGPTATAPLELADALYHIESTGVRGAQALDELKTAAEGAKVGHANLEDVTNALNASIASGIPGVQNMQQAMGALNSIVGAGDMKMQDLADAMGTGVLAVVKGYGLSLNDVGAALATFGDNNIRGSDAATKLRTAVQAMAVPAATAKKALGDIGMTTTQLSADLQHGGLNQAVTDLHDHLVAAGDAGAASGALLTEAFGKKAGPGIQILTDQFGRFEQKVQAVKDGAKGFGADWAATTHTLSFQMEQAKASADALGTKIGMALIPVVEKLIAFVMKIVEWFEKHKSAAEALGIALGTLAAALVAVGVAAFIAENAMTLGIGAAIAALIIGIVYLSTHWKQVWSDIKKVIDDATSWIRDHFYIIMAIPVIGWILVLAANWKSVWAGIQTAIQVAWSIIGPIFSFIKTNGTDFIEANILVFQSIWNAAWTAVSGAVNIAWSVIEPVFNFIKTGVTDYLETTIKRVQNIWNAAWLVISTAVSIAWSVIQPIFNLIKSAGFDFIEANILVFQSIWNAAWVVMEGAIQVFQSIWNGVWGAIVGPAMSAFNWLNGNILQPLASVFSQTIGFALSVAGTAWNTFWSGLSSVVSSAWGGIKHILNGIIDGINVMISGFDAATSWVPGVPNIPHIPHLAAGGSVDMGVPYLVGENGPELFIPSAAGNVLPSGSFGPGLGGAPIGGGGGTSVLEVNLVVNGQKFYGTTFNDLWTVLLQNKRSVMNLNLN